jgi:hypothetical protein
MFVELILAASVAAYVAVVALGHVLLIAAIYKYLREDGAGGRGRKAAAREQETAAAAGDAATQTATRLARRSGAARPLAAGTVIRLVRPDVEHPQHS